MKYLLSIIVCALISWLLLSILPWWIIIVPSFLLVGKYSKSVTMAFIGGLIGIGGLWGGLAFIQNNQNDSILATKVAEMFSLPNPILLILITAVIGGLIAGIAAVSGHLFFSIFRKETHSRYNYLNR